jgi:hypothetical protein
LFVGIEAIEMRLVRVFLEERLWYMISIDFMSFSDHWRLRRLNVAFGHCEDVSR